MVTNLYKLFVYLGDKTSKSNVEYTNNTTNEQGKKYLSMNFRMVTYLLKVHHDDVMM